MSTDDSGANSDYAPKNGLVRNYINLIIYEAIKLQPSQQYDRLKAGTPEWLKPMDEETYNAAKVLGQTWRNKCIDIMD